MNDIVPDPAKIKKLVKAEVNALLTAAKLKDDQAQYRQERQKLELARIAGASQWLIASLLAVNSAGVVVAMDSETLATVAKGLVAALYFLGIIAALVAGLFYRHSAYWNFIEATTLLKENKTDASETTRKIRRWDGRTEVVCWTSFGMFVIASIIVGDSVFIAVGGKG